MADKKSEDFIKEENGEITVDWKKVSDVYKAGIRLDYENALDCLIRLGVFVRRSQR